jgi:hypothetical protein
MIKYQPHRGGFSREGRRGMAKDDYFVIAYKVLRHLYECLKKGARPSMEILDAAFFGIYASYWEYIIHNLHEGGYITGVIPYTLPLHPGTHVKIMPDVNITPKGIEYLDENSMMKKVKGIIQDIREIMPI